MELQLLEWPLSGPVNKHRQLGRVRALQDVWARQWGDNVDCQGSLVVCSGLEWSLKIWTSTRSFGASSFGLV
jgi:hypothetical protein